MFFMLILTHSIKICKAVTTRYFDNETEDFK